MRQVVIPRYGDPDVLEACDAPDPAPGDDDIREWQAEIPNRLQGFFTDQLGRRWELQINGDSPDPSLRMLNFFVYREQNVYFTSASNPERERRSN